MSGGISLQPSVLDHNFTLLILQLLQSFCQASQWQPHEWRHQSSAFCSRSQLHTSHPSASSYQRRHWPFSPPSSSRLLRFSPSSPLWSSSRPPPFHRSTFPSPAPPISPCSSAPSP